MKARWKGREAVFALELPLILAASELPAGVDFGAKRESLPLAAHTGHPMSFCAAQTIAEMKALFSEV